MDTEIKKQKAVLNPEWEKAQFELQFRTDKMVCIGEEPQRYATPWPEGLTDLQIREWLLKNRIPKYILAPDPQTPPGN